MLLVNEIRAYRFFKILTPILSFFITSGAIFSQNPSLSFLPDKYTLLLAHFDQTSEKADYANGNENFAGSAALTEGYYGKGADLRLRGFYPDYLKKCNLPTQFYVQYGFWPIGNFNYYEGTVEFWFNLDKAETKGNLLWTYNGLYSSGIRLADNSSIIADWSCLKNIKVSSTNNLNMKLKPGDWHYFTMTWSQGEFVLYLDGKIVFTQDVSDGMGLVAARELQPIWIGSAHFETHHVSMIVDELRVSSIVRYKGEFEPGWNDGKRPSYAYIPQASHSRHAGKYEEPLIPQSLNSSELRNENTISVKEYVFYFDKADGFIKKIKRGDAVYQGSTGGILLWEGIEHMALNDEVKCGQWKFDAGRMSFLQTFRKGIDVNNTIFVSNSCMIWDAEINNQTSSEKWIEILLSLPVGLSQTIEYFDGNSIQTKLELPRRRDSTVLTMPLAIASDGEKSLGVGIDPHQWINAYISEWIPRGKAKGDIRQGTKVALDAKSSYNVRFMIIIADGFFGTLDALSLYHSYAPELYKVRTNVSPRMNMPLAWYNSARGKARERYGAQSQDIARQFYCGQEWLFGPHHVVGDFWGSEEYFNNPRQRERFGYKHYDVHYKAFGDTIEKYRRSFLKIFGEAHNSYYTSAALHLHPNWPWTGIAEDYYPNGITAGDRLNCGQYYNYSWGNYSQINHYLTPLGSRIKEQYRSLIDHCGELLIGFENDLNYLANARNYDPIAKTTPGRAFCRDLGTYVLDSLGSADYFKTVQERNRGMISDGGWGSHILSTVSDKVASEDNSGFFTSIGIREAFKNARNLLGEKAIEFQGDKDHAKYSDVIPEFESLSEKQLRDFYRYLYDQRFLYQSKYGGVVSPNLLRGFPKHVSYRPMITEGQMNGYMTVPAVKIPPPLWAVRYGERLNTILTIGNNEPSDITADVIVYNNYIARDRFFVFADFFSGETAAIQTFKSGYLTVIGASSIKARSLHGYRAVAEIDGHAESARAMYNGNGITFQLNLKINSGVNSDLKLRPFVPEDYYVKKVTMNGKQLQLQDAYSISGSCEISVEYQNMILDFAMEDWAKVNLLENTNANYIFRLNPGAEVYDKGTSEWIDRFFMLYDEEDGIPNNIVFTNTKISPWTIHYQCGGIEKSKTSRIKISSDKKSLWIGGPSKESARKAMSVFLRLLDRRYQHVGTWYPPLSESNWFKDVYILGGKSGGNRTQIDSKLKQLYEKFDFHKKILLETDEEYDKISNLDFTGKYRIRFSPYIYEPAYPTGANFRKISPNTNALDLNVNTSVMN